MKKRLVFLTLVLGLSFFSPEAAVAGYDGRVDSLSPQAFCQTLGLSFEREYGECCDCKQAKQTVVCSGGYYWGNCGTKSGADSCMMDQARCQASQPTPGPAECTNGTVANACLRVECDQAINRWVKIEKYCQGGHWIEKVGADTKIACNQSKPACAVPTPTPTLKPSPTPLPSPTPKITPTPLPPPAGITCGGSEIGTLSPGPCGGNKISGPSGARPSNCSKSGETCQCVCGSDGFWYLNSAQPAPYNSLACCGAGGAAAATPTPTVGQGATPTPAIVSITFSGAIVINNPSYRELGTNTSSLQFSFSSTLFARAEGIGPPKNGRNSFGILDSLPLNQGDKIEFMATVFAKNGTDRFSSTPIVITYTGQNTINVGTLEINIPTVSTPTVTPSPTPTVVPTPTPTPTPASGAPANCGCEPSFKVSIPMSACEEYGTTSCNGPDKRTGYTWGFRIENGQCYEIGWQCATGGKPVAGNCNCQKDDTKEITDIETRAECLGVNDSYASCFLPINESYTGAIIRWEGGKCYRDYYKCGQAAPPADSSLSGQVTGSIIANAEIVLTDEQGKTYLTQTDQNGHYTLNAPTNQTYQVKISAAGYKVLTFNWNPFDGKDYFSKIKLEKLGTEKEGNFEIKEEIGQLLVEGWNLISLAVQPAKTLKASEFLAEVNRQGGLGVTLSRWQDGHWETHLAGLAKNDFALEVGQAYFLENLKETRFNLAGEQIAKPQDLNLKPGWNAIGLPKTAQCQPPTCSAQMILNLVEKGKIGAAETIAKFESGLWGSVALENGEFFGRNFAFQAGQGYFLKVSKTLKLTP